MHQKESGQPKGCPNNFAKEELHYIRYRTFGFIVQRQVMRVNNCKKSLVLHDADAVEREEHDIRTTDDFGNWNGTHRTAIPAV